MTLRVSEFAFSSDTGRARTANEDSFYAQAPLFAVADGMGGAQAGEVASKIAAESFAPAVRKGEPPEAYLRGIAEAANERIHSLAKHDSTRSGMGTTLTAALVEGDDVSFAHVGDSRAYVWRDGALRLLTSDHSLVEELRRQGRISDEQAEDHPQRSIITRALGPEASVEVDTLSFSARPDDVFLLCSDGLTTMLKDDAIAAVLREATDLDDAAVRLVAAANEAGGRDNITVVAFRVEEGEAEPVGADGATLIGPSAEEAGLTGERVRAEAAAARSRPARRREPVAQPKRRGRTVAKVLAALVVLAIVVGGAIFGLRHVYFLGLDGSGHVSLYRGLPYDLPLGVSLYSEVESIPVQAQAIPVERRDSLVNHELRSHNDAVDLLDSIEASAVQATTQTQGGSNANANGNGGTNANGGKPNDQRPTTNNNRSGNGGNAPKPGSN